LAIRRQSYCTARARSFNARAQHHLRHADRSAAEAMTDLRRVGGNSVEAQQ
jgi:hypothetical protein